MTRTLVLAASALILSAGFVTADAAPRHRAKPHHAAMAHGRMSHGRMVSRGGDSQNSAVDQLNAQSLNAARGGAAPAQ